MRKVIPWLLLTCMACRDEASDPSAVMGPAANADGGLVAGNVVAPGDGGAPTTRGEGGGAASGSSDPVGRKPAMPTEEKLAGAFACDPASALRDLGASDGNVTRLLPADINKDGKDDLFMGSLADGDSSNPLDGYGVRLLLSGASGFTLSSKLDMPCGGGASECGLDMVVEDHDKDGKLDVLAVSPTWSKLMVYKGDGKGSFSQLGDDLKIDINPADYRFVDVDHDSDSDLVATMAQGCKEDQATVSAAAYCAGASQCSGELSCRHSFLGGGSKICLPKPCAGFQVLENQGPGGFVLTPLQTAVMDAVDQPGVGDVNGDGKLDAYVVSPDVRWFRAHDASFQPASALPLHGFLYNRAFDVDHDGRDELIVANHVLWSDADGNFMRATQHSFQDDPERLMVFRIDDTHTLVASGGQVGTGSSKQWTLGVSVFKGTQLTKHFDLCAKRASSDPIGTVTAADVDGDGKRELVVAGLKQDVVQVYDGAFND